MKTCAILWMILGIVVMALMIVNIDCWERSFELAVISLLYFGFGLSWYFMQDKP